VGLEPGDGKRRPRVPRLTGVLVRQAMQLVEALSAQALLLAVSRPERVPWELLAGWPGRLLVVTAERDEDFEIPRADTHIFDVPHASLSRMDRVNLGLLLAASSGVLNERTSVVCVSGADSARLDCINVTRPDAHLRAMFSASAARRSAVIRPAVILRVLSLAIELSAEGREARPVGAMFVIGDTAQVMRHARQLVLNPFHGFARHLRNLLDPSLSETIKEFALIDGAFIVQGDGTVLSAGTYLLPKTLPANLPSGLGARHQTAAAITAHTQALAVAVSQSTGTVTVFRNGEVVFTLERASLTRW
jgi:DNA integrity scanning protein DisA with diadenylate cyclase activity